MKALYFDVYHPNWQHYDKETLALFRGGVDFEGSFKQTFRTGGERHIEGPVIDVCGRGERNACQTAQYLAQPGAITLFEAGFIYDGILVLADVLQRSADGTYTIYEVKNSLEVKPVLLNDIAVQHYVITHCVGTLQAFNLVHNDGSGGFSIIDQQQYASTQHKSIAEHIVSFNAMLQNGEPDIEPGEHCQSPYPCPYIKHCSGCCD